VKEEKKQGRSDRQRLKLLFLKKYLLENTDVDHPVKVTHIQSYLENERISVERKTVYTDIKLLNDDDDDITIETKRKAGEYFVAEREFELTDLQLIIDCIQTSQFLTQKYADELSEKLKTLTSRHGRKALNRRCSTPKRVRNMNGSAFWGIEDIHKAIDMNCKISFTFKGWDGDEDWIVSPVLLAWGDSHYFLHCVEHYGDHPSSKGYVLVDLMYDIRILEDEPREDIELFDKSDFDKLPTVTLIVDELYYKELLYFFDNNVKIIKKEKSTVKQDDNECVIDEFTVIVKTEVNSSFFEWLLEKGDGVDILSPNWVIEELYKYVVRRKDFYLDGEKLYTEKIKDMYNV